MTPLPELSLCGLPPSAISANKELTNTSSIHSYTYILTKREKPEKIIDLKRDPCEFHSQEGTFPISRRIRSFRKPIDRGLPGKMAASGLRLLASGMTWRMRFPVSFGGKSSGD